MYLVKIYNVGLWFHWSVNNKNTDFALNMYFSEMKTSLEFLKNPRAIKVPVSLKIFSNTGSRNFKNVYEVDWLRGLFSAKWLVLNYGMKFILNHLKLASFSSLLTLVFLLWGLRFLSIFNIQFSNYAFCYQLNNLILCYHQCLDFDFTFNLTMPFFFTYHFNNKQCVYHVPKCPLLELISLPCLGFKL